jgi:hypothetical protein
MGPVSGDQDVVTRTKITLTFALNAETRRAGEEQDPFVMSLTMWFIHRRGLTSRDDPLDTHVLSRKKLGEDLPVCASRKVIEKIDHLLAPNRGRSARTRIRARCNIWRQ